MCERAPPHSAVIESRRCSYPLSLLCVLTSVTVLFYYVLLLALVLRTIALPLYVITFLSTPVRQGLSVAAAVFVLRLYNLSDGVIRKWKDGCVSITEGA